MELAPDYQFLHLAMHAYTDEEDPAFSGLVFEGSEGHDPLHAFEIANLQLNAEMAVLSAWNTGSGKLIKGEGLISLARSFRLAGCDNTVMSLWQADDVATSLIMNGFYANLKKGLPRSEALQKAKLDYLDTNSNAFPYFWSAFILSGNNEVVTFTQKSNTILYLLLSFVLLGLMVFLFSNRRKTK